MWLVKHSSPVPDKDALAVPESDAAALRAAYKGNAEKREESDAVALVKRARAFDLWIACNCRQAERIFPLMTPAYLTTARTYYLRRLTGGDRPNHSDTCPFRFDRPEPGLGKIRAALDKPTASPTGYFTVLTKKDGSSLATQPEPLARNKQLRAGPPPLARQLWRLIDKARLNRLALLQGAPRPTIRLEFASIRDAAEQIDVSAGTALARVMATHPDDYHSRRLFARIRAAAKRSNARGPLQGFLLTYVPDVKGKSLLFDGKEPIIVAGEIERPPVEDKTNLGPYLALTVVGEHRGAGGLTALRSYAQPIYTGAQFVPVDSAVERQALRVVNSARRRLVGTAPSLAISIVKPLFSIDTPSGPCQPDFMVEIVDHATGEIRNVVIDILASDTPAYLEAKRQAQMRMKTIGPVVELTPREVENRNAAMQVLIEAIGG